MGWQNFDWIGPVITVVAVSLVMGALRISSRAPAKLREGFRWVEYSRILRIALTVALLIPVGLIVLSSRVGEDNRGPVIFMAVLFGLLIIPLAIEILFVKIGYNDQKLICCSPWRKNRTITMFETGEPRYSTSMQWWSVSTGIHGNIRISLLITGGADLVRRICELRGFPLPAAMEPEEGDK